jgi:protein TonB
MSRELFTDVVSPQVRVRSSSRYTIVVSVAAHALIVAAVIIVPLMATSAMPPLASGIPDFMLVAGPPAPPPLPTPPAPASATSVHNRDAAPRDMPTEIGEELPPATTGDTADGGVPTLGPPTGSGFGSSDGIGRDVGAPVPPPVPAPPTKPVRPGGDIREPVKVKNVPPVYPEIAIRARISGRVVIDAVIGTDGVVREVRILSGVPLLNQAAIDAVRQWRYTPTTLNNVPVPVIMTVTVQFNLQ